MCRNMAIILKKNYQILTIFSGKKRENLTECNFFEKQFTKTRKTGTNKGEWERERTHPKGQIFMHMKSQNYKHFCPLLNSRSICWIWGSEKSHNQDGVLCFLQAFSKTVGHHFQPGLKPVLINSSTYVSWSFALFQSGWDGNQTKSGFQSRIFHDCTLLFKL